ncbi:MAG: GntR family transcriptional regulator [Acidobacteriota bacterium]
MASTPKTSRRGAGRRAAPSEPPQPGITIDLGSSVPLYQQIADEMRRLVAQQQIAAGHELPSVRKLGAMLGVNLNTVAKAYRTLAAEGVIELRHGSRARVRADCARDPAPAVAEDDEINRRLDDLLGRLRLQGASRSQVEALFERAVARFFPTGDTP